MTCSRKVIVELDSEGYYVNGVTPSVPPDTIGGRHPFSSSASKVKILLSGGQFIELNAARSIRINAHGSDFYDTNGMSGKWDRLGLVGRDDVSTFDDPELFAKEWEVNTALGNPQLFRAAASNACGESPKPTQPDPALLELATMACAHIPKEDNKKECVFDVITTGDTSFAANEVYVNPLEPEELCGPSSTDCVLRGGNCVWRCDSEVASCLPGLCELTHPEEVLDGDVTRKLRSAVVEGCSCAVPRVALGDSQSTSPAPTTSDTEPPPSFTDNDEDNVNDHLDECLNTVLPEASFLKGAKYLKPGHFAITMADSMEFNAKRSFPSKGGIFS